MEYGLPKSVEIDGEQFAIRYDFRVILDIFEAINDPELTGQERALAMLQIFYVDFDRLTGNDSLAIEDELQSMNKPVIVPTFSGQYLIRMAARACTTTLPTPDGRTRRIGADVIQALPIGDYNRIRSKARTFLLASEL